MSSTSSISGASNSSSYSPTGGLITNGKDTVDTGRYLITAQEGELKIFDKQSNTWVRAWGDPHVDTSDGDKAQFQSDSLTFDLQDGTKVTIKPTKVTNGVSLIDEVAIMKGKEAIVIKGFSDGQPGVTMGQVQNNAGEVDAAYQDGTVLKAGNQVDDLFTTTGREIVGGDASQPSGEHMLDGLGGTSSNQFSNIYDKLFAILAKLQGDFENAVNELDKKDPNKSEYQSQMFKIQQLQSQMQQIQTMATNMSKTEHDTKMSIIRNFAA